jgi:hypothetical protein
VPDTFEPEDLVEMKDLPKVTKCVEELAEIVRQFRHLIVPTNLHLKDFIFQFSVHNFGLNLTFANVEVFALHIF